MEGKVILKAQNIYKSFGATKALKNVSLELREGEVMALIGENGSGKSTLSSVITGALKRDSGEIWFHDKEFHSNSVLEARKAGIAILAQELGTVNGMTVAENIFLGMENEFQSVLGINRSKMNREARKMLEKIGAGHIQSSSLVDSLGFETRKLIEVARALYHNPDVLIVDETTTALSQAGRDTIYQIIRDMKKQNKAIIFISHDLDEIKAVCDTVEILRDGEYVTKLEGEEVTQDNMRKNMIGRDLSGHYYREDNEPSWQDTVTLKVSNINRGMLQDISFELHAGEILGLGGLTECGMHELCKIIYGALKPDSGSVVVMKNQKEIHNTTEALAQKVAYLPKDRDQESLFLSTSIMDNITVSSFDKLKKGILIFPKDEKELAGSMAEKLSIKMQNISQNVQELSGGNKQKVVVAKWLANDSDILIMDCPTRGIDIGVKASIYQLMENLKKEGKSIIMVSEEMPELIGMSDRIIVMKDGKITGTFKRNEVDEKMLIHKII